ncbi:hypothetical protein [Mycobacterium sp. NPDC050853]|uniref:hypothetical protein n=1 Tax=Mycobacterium sp. NPDC050853 TaxID=3155160 RepID=UPI0034104B3A
MSLLGLLDNSLTAVAELYEPKNGWGLAGLLIIGMPSLVTAGVSGVILWRQRKSAHDMNEVKTGVAATNAQVVNGHGGKAPLRSDMDLVVEIAQRTELAVAEVRGELRGLTHRVDELSKAR